MAGDVGPGMAGLVMLTMAEVLKRLYRKEFADNLARADTPLKVDALKGAHVLAHASALLSVAEHGIAPESLPDRQVVAEELRAVIEKHFGLFYDDRPKAAAGASQN